MCVPAQRGQVAARLRMPPASPMVTGPPAGIGTATDDRLLTWGAAAPPSGPRWDRFATVVADALLAGEWTEPAMHVRVRQLTAARRHRRWHTAVVTAALSAYPLPPTDRPRELASLLASLPVLLESDPRAGFSAELDSMRRHVDGSSRHPWRGMALPTRMMRRPFPGPALDGAADLAEYLELDVADLVRLADTDNRTRRARADALRHYRYRWVARPAGPRLWEIPRPRLRAVQLRVLRGILAGVPVHPAAHGFVPGRSAVTGAAVHAGADVVIGLDLSSFFASVTAGRVWGVLRAAGYPEPVCLLLTGLLTHAVPPSVIAAMPAGGGGSHGFRLRRYLAAPHLPQGAPSSPAVANLVCWSLDRRLVAYAGACGARYTRYADDLTFSGGPRLARSAGALIAAVGSIARQEGFSLNPDKTRVRRSHQRQVVTGVVVNAGTNQPRRDADRLRAVLHDCVVHGPAAANRLAHPDFRDHLLGRIAWAAQLNARRGERLRAQFDRVDWG